MAQWPSILAALKKYKYLLLVIVAGLVLILWPFGQESPSAELSGDEAYPEFSVSDMEERVEKALASMDGAGRVDVVLTLHSDMHVLVQEDVTAESHREQIDSVHSDYTTSSQRKTVILSSGNVQQPLVTKRIYPEFEGALIVCDGGDSAMVRLAVVEAVSALTGLRSDKISVVKMKK